MTGVNDVGWLQLRAGSSPLIVSVPHAGTWIPAALEGDFGSAWLARKDADWYVDRLYDFALGLGATLVTTRVSRSVVDVNRDPSGRSLYPGQATTELCPTTTFDGEPLYRPGREPDAAAVLARRQRYFDPYHACLGEQVERCRAEHGCAVLFDAHSIRSRVPRLFDGELPVFNLGTNSGVSCAPALAAAVERRLDEAGESRVSNGRFKGGFITRHFGAPSGGVHALQLEMAMRAYLAEPEGALHERNWPPAFDAARAARLAVALRTVLEECLRFAERGGHRPTARRP